MARELPTGTVTMLFSDIEGSTLLLSHLGPNFLDALDRHRRILREAWEGHGGTEMGTEGDSFFVVFPTADAAVAAAVQGQRGLAEHPWPEGKALRVRIGIHTGSPQVHDDDYWGMDVHRAARIAGAAHGGQVVVSAATADLARTNLPDGVLTRDLGAHHLKDIASPEHLLELVVDGLQQDFPPLRTLGATSSLPHPTTPLLGREREVEELAGLVGSPGVRLVTLTGHGGSGKTRLAIAAAGRVADDLVDRFPDGVFFVSLAAVTTADVMWTSMAETLDAPARERTPERLLGLLARRKLMLVLDNVEQVAGADEVVERVLGVAVGVSVVTTSRQPLGLAAERRYAVIPLRLPRNASMAAAEQSAAVQLFVQRAVSVLRHFELTAENVGDVVGICRRLDGLPLAIELCASRMRVLGPKALLARLDQALALDIASTSRLVPERQRTLRETIAWSYDLLSPQLRGCFLRLGVFAGGADLDAVAAVTPCGRHRGDPVDVIAELVDASLANVSEGPDGEPRVSLLETIRAFAIDELRAGDDADDARTAHAAHYSGVAERLGRRRESGHLVALRSAETELENFREALEWTVPRPGHPDAGRGDLTTGLRLCAALNWAWQMGGYFEEGRTWSERAIDAAGGESSPQVAACLSGLSALLLAQGDADRARTVAERGLAMARELDDEPVMASTLGVRGTSELHLGEVAAARDSLRASLELYRKGGDVVRLGRTLGNLGGLEATRGDVEAAEALIRESLEVFERICDDHEAAVQRQNLANLLALAGRVDEADEIARELVEAVLRLRSPNLTMAFANTYMNILLRRGEPTAAAHLFGAEETMRERLATPNPFRDEELAEALELVDGTMTAQEWDRERLVGHGRTVEDLLAERVR